MDISRGVLPRGAVKSTQARQNSPEHVLHVFSLTAGIGGHTRMVWRWIQEDQTRRHSVVITHQGLIRLPPQLRDAVESTGGELHLLDDRRGNLISWSAQLRNIARSTDLVVLHTNPDDIIPIIAFAEADDLPPVVLLNHADHVFWLGASISTLIANQRESGLDLTRDRRGIAPERCGMLPIIVEPRQRKMSRAEAKRQLGLSPDAVVLLSIARPHKFKQTCPSFPIVSDLFYPDALVPVLREHANTIMLAVGADSNASWERAMHETGGRALALGVREDTSVYYEAADIYLDSFPITSITSLLEAGSYNVPLVTCNPHPAGADVLGSDTPGLGQYVTRARNVDEYTAALSLLIQHPELRKATGRSVRNDIVTVHAGQGWIRYLDEMYLTARSLQRVNASSSRDDGFHTADLDVLLLALFRGKPDITEIMTHHLRNMPMVQRISHWSKTRRDTGYAPPGRLLPEWMGIRVEKWRQPDGRDLLPQSFDDPRLPANGRIGDSMRNGQVQ